MNEERAPIDNLAAFNRDDVVANPWYTSNDLTACERDVFDRFLRRGMDVLDLCVGVGRTSEYLAGLGGRYVGVDFAPAMIDMARRLHPGIEFAHGDVRDLSAYGDASFDAVVISYNGIDFLYPSRSRQQCVAECCRVLRPGGIFIMSSHNPRALVLPLGDPARRTRLVGLLVRGCAALVRAAKVVHRREFWSGGGYGRDLGRIDLWTFFATPRYVVQELELAGLTHLATLGSNFPDRSSTWPDRVSQWFEPWYYYVACP